MHYLLSPALGVLLLLAGACSRPNPDFCCVTAESCAAAGLAGELRPCEVGQACRSYECIAAECVSSENCTSPDAPTCFNGLCAAGCSSDDDCAGIAGQPRCDLSDGACVGCTADEQCPADRAFCDAESRACRGCTADDQCASGVCIEATGLCADPGEVIYVAESGTDAGTCTEAAPCKSMSYALGLTSAARNVIRILGSTYPLGNGLGLTGSVVVDGSNTSLTSSVSPAIVATGTSLLEGVRMSSTDAFSPLLQVGTEGELKLFQVRVETGQIEVAAGGRLEALGVQLSKSNIECKSGGTLLLRRSALDRSSIDSSCRLVISETFFETPPGAFAGLRFGGPSQLIENNVFVSREVGTSQVFISSPSGSTFRFNTMASISSGSSDVATIGCVEGVDMASNIIASGSTRPTSCVSRYSLFDEVGAQAALEGIGNRSADRATFFRDRQAGDLRLSAQSPALGLGEVGLITTDFEGKPRPVPAGSMPDAGAHEAP